MPIKSHSCLDTELTYTIGGEKRGRESFLDARGVIAIDAMIKCRVDLVYQLVVLRIMS